MMTFKEWMQRKNETFAVSPSIVDDEGDNAEKVGAGFTKEHPGAMPVYSPDELPPTPANDPGKKNSKKLSKKK